MIGQLLNAVAMPNVHKCLLLFKVSVGLHYLLKWPFMSALATWNMMQNPLCLWLDVNHFYQAKQAWS